MIKHCRVILRIPKDLTFDQLPPQLQDGINSIFGQFVMPMPGTVEADGYKLCDAVTATNFNPANMANYGINWPILGLWGDDGSVITELDVDTFMAHLPEPEEGPKVLHEPHRWSGWPDLFG